MNRGASILKTPFYPQITQIDADFKRVADEYQATLKVSRESKATYRLICENLRNLRITAFFRFIVPMLGAIKT